MKIPKTTAETDNIANTLLPAVLVVKTRYEAEDAMKAGKTFEATCYLIPYNKNMLDFYMSKYSYNRTKVKRGVDLYEPIK